MILLCSTILKLDFVSLIVMFFFSIVWFNIILLPSLFFFLLLLSVLSLNDNKQIPSRIPSMCSSTFTWRGMFVCHFGMCLCYVCVCVCVTTRIGTDNLVCLNLITQINYSYAVESTRKSVYVCGRERERER